MKQFSASTPRRMYWSDEVGGCSRCPQCSGHLLLERHSYYVAVRRGGRIEGFLVGNDGGHFCRGCPVVVIDSEVFRDCLESASAPPRGAEFAVLGIVDLSAVPEDRRHLPFDEQHNPLPLVKFLQGEGRRVLGPH